MNNNNGKGREIFYGVIGVSTLKEAIEVLKEDN